jgi:hypothetical protein
MQPSMSQSTIYWNRRSRERDACDTPNPERQRRPSVLGEHSVQHIYQIMAGSHPPRAFRYPVTAISLASIITSTSSFCQSAKRTDYLLAPIEPTDQTLRPRESDVMHLTPWPPCPHKVHSCLWRRPRSLHQWSYCLFITMGLFNELGDQRMPIIIATAIFLFLAWVTVSLRIWVRCVMIRSVGWDDAALIFTTVSRLPCSSLERY